VATAGPHEDLAPFLRRRVLEIGRDFEHGFDDLIQNLLFTSLTVHVLALDPFRLHQVTPFPSAIFLAGVVAFLFPSIGSVVRRFR
jgi:hypothetical protein